MRSPTILPLAQEGWCSLHAVIGKAQLWERIERLKAIGAEGILVLALENMNPIEKQRTIWNRSEFTTIPRATRGLR